MAKRLRLSPQTTGGGKKKGGACTCVKSLKKKKKRLHNYSAAPWQPSPLQLKCAVMEPSGDLINLLIGGKRTPIYGQ